MIRRMSVFQFAALNIAVLVLVGGCGVRYGGAQPYPPDAAGQAACAGDFGEWAYLNYPDMIIRAIRVAEGVPSYGVMYLAEQYGGHDKVPWREGRAAAAVILHATYYDWHHTVRRSGSCYSFLRYLSQRYAPVGAANDPGGLNDHWLENVVLNVAMQVAERESR